MRKDVALLQAAAALIASDALSDSVRQSTERTQNGTAVDALRAEQLGARHPAPVLCRRSAVRSTRSTQYARRSTRRRTPRSAGTAVDYTSVL